MSILLRRGLREDFYIHFIYLFCQINKQNIGMNTINLQGWPRGNQEVYKAWAPQSKKIKWEEVINSKTDT